MVCTGNVFGSVGGMLFGRIPLHAFSRKYEFPHVNSRLLVVNTTSEGVQFSPCMVFCSIMNNVSLINYSNYTLETDLCVLRVFWATLMLNIVRLARN